MKDKIVGITVQIMLLSNCGKMLSKVFEYCAKMWHFFMGVLLESYAKTPEILCYYYWKSVRNWCNFLFEKKISICTETSNGWEYYMNYIRNVYKQLPKCVWIDLHIYVSSVGILCNNFSNFVLLLLEKWTHFYAWIFQILTWKCQPYEYGSKHVQQSYEISIET